MDSDLREKNFSVYKVLYKFFKSFERTRFIMISDFMSKSN